jgi:hypothetical protein
MKKLLFSLIFSFIGFFLFAQPRNSTVEYLKEKRDAVAMDIPFSEKTVNNAIVDAFQKLGYKGKENKGFLVFKEVKIKQMGDKPLDFYFLTERKNRKEKDATTLSIAFSRDLDQFITEAEEDEIFNNAKNYLEDLRNTIYYYDLEDQIKSQAETLAKSEKKLNSLVDDGKDLEKRKKKLDEQIETNSQNQIAQKTDAEAQKQVLEKLKEKRKS